MGNCNSGSAANLANEATGGCARRVRRGQVTRIQSVDSIEVDERKLNSQRQQGNPSKPQPSDVQSSKTNAVTVSSGSGDGGGGGRVDVDRKLALDENKQHQANEGSGIREEQEQERKPSEEVASIRADGSTGNYNNNIRTNDDDGANEKQKHREVEDPAIRLQKLKEGLDFIETEEDVKAVESAALKIQSTFRGKKFRSKKPAAPEASASGVVNGGSISTSQVKNQPEVRGEEAAKKKLSSEEESELNKRVAGIQVNDNSNNNTSDSSSKMASSSSAAPEATTNNNAVASNLPEEEAERAATKIQAGFKGYKTRKELEGKLGGSGDSAGDGAAGGKAEVAPQDGEK